jgi:ribosomal-protein-alanine N-acetyltransferase
MINSELSLRLARLIEANSIAHLSRDLIESGLNWRWTPERVAKSIRAANVNVLVASMHNEIAGFAIMRYGDDDAHLDLLAVTPPHRRTGIGRQLLEWLEECAVVAGIFNVDLEVRAGNEEAQLFYSRMVTAHCFSFRVTIKVSRRRFVWAEICPVGLSTRELIGSNPRSLLKRLTLRVALNVFGSTDTVRRNKSLLRSAPRLRQLPPPTRR